MNRNSGTTARLLRALLPLYVIVITMTVASWSIANPGSDKSLIDESLSKWYVRDVGMTAITHDTVCHQYERATMVRLVGYVAQFHANYASDDINLDDDVNYINCKPGPLSAYQYKKAWATTMHAAGLHVLFRGNWNNWSGAAGTPKLTYNTTPAIPYEEPGGLAAVENGTDKISYLGRTYQYILQHPDLFEDRDIFAPFGEPQNNGIANGPTGTSAAYCPKGLCQFPSTAAFNQWLSDMIQAEQDAFRKIGKHVYTGWLGLAVDSYKYVDPQAIARADFYNMDHFAKDFLNFTMNIQASYNKFHLPIVLEWGDIFEGGRQPMTANTTNKYLEWLANQPYIVGLEYWQLAGNSNTAPERAVDTVTGQPTQTGQVLAKWFARKE